jgi:hypothetical protein
VEKKNIFIGISIIVSSLIIASSIVVYGFLNRYFYVGEKNVVMDKLTGSVYKVDYSTWRMSEITLPDW